MKKQILRIYDFIRSWIYYPKLCKYFMKSMPDETFVWFMGEYNSRWKYALWHCKRGKLSDVGYEKLKPTIKDISDGWRCTYRNEQIGKN